MHTEHGTTLHSVERVRVCVLTSRDWWWWADWQEAGGAGIGAGYHGHEGW